MMPLEVAVQTKEDRAALEKCAIDPALLADDGTDYSTVVVKKPWGYEYLIYQNGSVAVWVLHMKPGSQTSMHCHPNKKTSLVVLEQSALCRTLSCEFSRPAGTGLMIGKGVFHQTVIPEGTDAFVLEVESPINKRDLVRLDDEYGRAGEGYETVSKSAFSPNYNYLSLERSSAAYNTTKRFGSCTLAIRRVSTEAEFSALVSERAEDILAVLGGSVFDERGSVLLGIGDTVGVRDLAGRRVTLNGGVELLLVKPRDRFIKVSDAVMGTLKAHGVREVFFTPGDANVHLLDSLGRDEQLEFTAIATERGASMAAEAYAKRSGKVGVLVLSSGASGTNALSGVASAWTDSAPLVVLSGQANAEQLGSTNLRQLGNKSLPIAQVARPLVKSSTCVMDARHVPAAVASALERAQSDRPGPVWVDIPIDLQGQTVDAQEFVVAAIGSRTVRGQDPSFKTAVAEAVELLRTARRPVLLVGNGVRLAGAHALLLDLLQSVRLPVLLSRRGADLLSEDHPFYFGRPGAYGQRSANFIIQNSDVLLVVGARLSIPQIGRNTRAFARGAKKIIVDIDPAELAKPTVRPDVPIVADVAEFLRQFLVAVGKEPLPDYRAWIATANEYRRRFSPDREGYVHMRGINPYLFVRDLSAASPAGSTIVVDGGAPMNYTMQTYAFKVGSRLLCSIGVELPGYALTAAIGASVAVSRGEVLCLTEDRGLLSNVHELQTIVDNALPVKIFVLASKGHADVRKIQREYFGGRLIGTTSRVPFGAPDIVRLGSAYGMNTFAIHAPSEIEPTIREVLQARTPSLCVVDVDEQQEISPRIVMETRSDGVWEALPLEDMYPFLDRAVLKQNMIVDLWK